MIERDALNRARDVFEILAITVAAFWTTYVFAYEQRIKPASEPPSMSVSATLSELGARDNLIQIRFKSLILNTGRTDSSIIGLGFTAVGISYTLKSLPFVLDHHGIRRFQRDARVLSRTRVYELTELSKLADKSFEGMGVTLSPGEKYPYHGIFLVKRGEFDAIALYGSVAYAKEDVIGKYPTNLARTSAGAVELVSRNSLPSYYSLLVPLDEITLW